MIDKKKASTPPIQVSRKMVFVARGVVLVVFLVWVIGIFYFYSQVQETERQIAALQQKQQQQQELLRRQAIYQRASMEQQAVQSGVQNAVDAFKQ